MFDNLRADLRRLDPGEGFGTGRRGHLLRGLLSPGFQAVATYRFFRWCKDHRIPTQPLRFLVERFTEITTGAHIPVDATIGPGLRIHHHGPIVLHPDTIIGRQCTIYQGVTVGDRGGYGGAARIGDRVTLGAGAKIIGEVAIGDDTIIGANCVVRDSIPEGMVASGDPAEVRPRGSVVGTEDAPDALVY